MKNIFFYETNIGTIGIVEENQQITNVLFEADSCFSKNAGLNTALSEQIDSNRNMIFNGYQLNESHLIKEASNQLYEYLQGERQRFSLPLAPSGTTFMKKVWECLCNIPYGKTKSYKEIALAAGNERACRAVGLANNRNPIPLFIPCHRVIGSNGKLIGYRGGLQTKQALLALEKQYADI